MITATNIAVVLIVVPLVTAFIRDIINWAAVKMIFEPEEFVGIAPGGVEIGWQGLLSASRKSGS